MSCFTKVTHTLRSGNLDEYNKNLGDPTKLTTNTYHHKSDSYHTHNVNWSYGITRYGQMKAHIESYTGSSIGCIHVNDLGATYNALNEALGLPDRALNPSQMKNLYKEKDATLPKQPQGKGAIQAKNAKRQAFHLLNSRGVQGGSVVVNVQEIIHRLDQQRILAEKKSIEETLRLAQIEKLRKETEVFDEKIKSQKIEYERFQKTLNDEDNRLSKQLEEKVKQDEIKRNQIILEPEIIPAVVASSSLIPLAVIGLLLYTSRGKK